jgi:hypothetical protein
MTNYQLKMISKNLKTKSLKYKDFSVTLRNDMENAGAQPEMSINLSV